MEITPGVPVIDASLRIALRQFLPLLVELQLLGTIPLHPVGSSLPSSQNHMLQKYRLVYAPKQHPQSTRM